MAGRGLRALMPLPVDLPEPSESSLLTVAWSCFYAVQMLHKTPNNHMLVATGILAAHGIEATLKSHLQQHGWTHDEVRRRVGHDLLENWTAAASVGAPIEREPPGWLKLLNWGHARPYPYRYLPDKYGVGVPKLEDFMPWWEGILRSLQRSSASL